MADKVLAWHGDPKLKERTIARMETHAEADRFMQGAYVSVDATGKDWKGCLHGCLAVEDVMRERSWTLRDLDSQYGRVDWHLQTERLLGIPARVGSILDHLYEESEGAYADLAIDILEAIPVGADLSGIIDPWDVWVEDSPGPEFVETWMLYQLRNAPIPTQVKEVPHGGRD